MNPGWSESSSDPYDRIWFANRSSSAICFYGFSMRPSSANQRAKINWRMRSEQILKTGLREPRKVIVSITLSHNSDIETSELLELGHGFLELIIIGKCCYDSCYSSLIFGQITVNFCQKWRSRNRTCFGIKFKWPTIVGFRLDVHQIDPFQAFQSTCQSSRSVW